MKPGLAVIVALLASAPALEGQTLDDIVAKNLEARGGRERLKALRSVRMSGTLKLGPGSEASLTMEFLRPNMVRTAFTLRGLTAVQAYDGKTAWQIMPFAGKSDPEPLTGDDLASMEEQADVEGDLVDWKTKGLAVELLGREAVEGTEAWKLRISRKRGAVKTMWLDAGTFLEIREESEREFQGKPAVFVTTLGDYRSVGGLMVPFLTESRAKGGVGGQKITLTTVEFDVPIDPDLFRLPAPKPAPPKTPGR